MAFNKSKALEEAARLVSQKKLSPAIKLYLAITDQDPDDLTLLNNVGDLCIRDGNIPEALRQFYKLAERYEREGFSLRAIAIYKKIAKLETRSAGALLKLAELYKSQGLSHEAREQYAQALAFCEKNSLRDKALQILNQLVTQEPENAGYRLRLAESYEAAGKSREAFQYYFEAAAQAHRHRNLSVAEAALKKAAGIDPRNAEVLLLEARLAAERGQFDEVEKVVGASPELGSNREAQRLLFEACLSHQKLEEAGALAVEAYRNDPDDFTVLGRFSAACLNAGQPDAIPAPLAEVAGLALQRQHASALLELLRQVLAAQPRRDSSLDLIGDVLKQAGDAQESAEVLKALGGAFGARGEWAKAECVYRALIVRDESNEAWQALLKEALHQQEKGSAATAQEVAPTNAENAIAQAEPAEEQAALDQRSTEAAPSTPEIVEAPLVEPSIEIDFAAEWQAFAAPQATAPAQSDSAEANLKEEIAEIKFYLDHDFFSEGLQALEALETKYPGHPQLAELRQRAEERENLKGTLPEPAFPAEEPPWSGFPFASGDDGSLLAAQEESPQPPESGPDFAPAAPPETAPFSPAPEQHAPEMVEVAPQEFMFASSEMHAGDAITPQSEAIPQESRLLEDLALDLEESLDVPGTTQAVMAREPPEDWRAENKLEVMSPLFEDILKELESDQEADPSRETPQAHYNLGVAFREMGLLEEAIGEFQKVVKGAGPDYYPPYFVEACSLLGLCFMEKRMAGIAVRWFLRALAAPRLDEETRLGLTYDLALAYEQSGDLKTAFEKFSEVYSVNVDYREIAEKVRALQQKCT